MSFFINFKRPYYSGEEGDLVRIPCKTDSGNIIFTGTGKSIAIYESLMGKKAKKDRNKMWPMHYFGFIPAKDETEYTYRRGYTATHVGNGTYSVNPNDYSKGEYIAMEIAIGASEDVAMNPKSNVNKWLKAVAKPPRGLLYWLIGIVTTPFVIGAFMLVDAFYRLGLNFSKKKCLKKAKKSYKQNGNTVVVF